MSHPNPQEVYEDSCDYCGKPITDEQPKVSGPDGPVHVAVCADAVAQELQRDQYIDDGGQDEAEADAGAAYHD